MLRDVIYFVCTAFCIDLVFWVCLWVISIAYSENRRIVLGRSMSIKMKTLSKIWNTSTIWSLYSRKFYNFRVWSSLVSEAFQLCMHNSWPLTIIFTRLGRPCDYSVARKARSRIAPEPFKLGKHFGMLWKPGTGEHYSLG